MKPPIYSLSAACLVLLAAACTNGSATPQYIEVNEQDIEICCDPNQGPPGKVGEFAIFINATQLAFLDPASIEASIVYSGTVGTSARLDIVSTASLPLGTTTVQVFLDDCDFTEIEIDMTITVSGVRNDSRRSFTASSVRSLKITNTCPPTQPMVTPPQQIAEDILGEAIANFSQYTQAAPTGVPTANSNPNIAQRIPDPVTEVFQIGFVAVDLDQADLDRAFTGPNALFPVGQGPHGLTVEADNPVVMMPGRYLLTWQCVGENIPHADPVKQFQFAYVADRDLVKGNNYQAQAPFEGDYFDDTDLWFSAEYQPTQDWSLRVTDARNGNFNAVTSAARVIFYNQVQFFVLPADEFGGGFEADGRYSTFSHEGDFGQMGGPWSADPTPRVEDPLLRFQWQLAL